MATCVLSRQHFVRTPSPGIPGPKNTEHDMERHMPQCRKKPKPFRPPAKEYLTLRWQMRSEGRLLLELRGCYIHADLALVLVTGFP